jgi:hypothetical protein
MFAKERPRKLIQPMSLETEDTFVPKDHTVLSAPPRRSFVLLDPSSHISVNLMRPPVSNARLASIRISLVKIRASAAHQVVTLLRGRPNARALVRIEFSSPRMVGVSANQAMNLSMPIWLFRLRVMDHMIVSQLSFLVVQPPKFGIRMGTVYLQLLIVIRCAVPLVDLSSSPLELAIAMDLRPSMRFVMKTVATQLLKLFVKMPILSQCSIQ